jgi:hypothetical protein
MIYAGDKTFRLPLGEISETSGLSLSNR